MPTPSRAHAELRPCGLRDTGGWHHAALASKFNPSSLEGCFQLSKGANMFPRRVSSPAGSPDLNSPPSSPTQRPSGSSATTHAVLDLPRRSALLESLPLQQSDESPAQRRRLASLAAASRSEAGLQQPVERSLLDLPTDVLKNLVGYLEETRDVAAAHCTSRALLGATEDQMVRARSETLGVFLGAEQAVEILRSAGGRPMLAAVVNMLPALKERGFSTEQVVAAATTSRLVNMLPALTEMGISAEQVLTAATTSEPLPLTTEQIVALARRHRQ